jgi:hypothetical protein
MKEYKVILKTSVDDYEHSGDFDNEKRAWQNLGFNVRNNEYVEDAGTVCYEVACYLNDKIIQDTLEILTSHIKCMKGLRCQDWSEILHPDELINLLSQCDNQNGTHFENDYKNIIKQVSDYYCNGGETPNGFSPLAVENIIESGKRGVSNKQMIPAIKSALKDMDSVKGKLQVLKSNYPEIFQSSLKYLTNTQQELVRDYFK